MYYQIKSMQEVGNYENEDEFMDDEELNSQYGEEVNNNMEYGSIDDEEDIGVNNDGNDDNDDNEDGEDGEDGQ
jgi:hypothetical protein